MPRVSLSWVVVLGLLSAIGPLCTDFYLPALPEITEQLSATGTQTQLSLTAALIGLGLGQMFFGPAVWQGVVEPRSQLLPVSGLLCDSPPPLDACST